MIFSTVEGRVHTTTVCKTLRICLGFTEIDHVPSCILKISKIIYNAIELELILKVNCSHLKLCVCFNF